MTHTHAKCNHAKPHIHPDRSISSKAFPIAVGLNLGFVVVEWIFGVMSHSLALIADAGHNLSDVLGLFLVWGAVALSKRRPCKRFTYGLGRSSILAALFNALLLMAAIGGIVWEAVRRFASPPAVEAHTVIWVAAAGIVINTGTALLFLKDQKRDLNIRGAYLHMALDALVSLGVVAAGLVMLWTGWRWLDPVLSLLIAVIILVSTWDLLKHSLRLALDGVPPGVELDEVKTFLCSYSGVKDVHHLHIWAMSTTQVALSVHLVVEPTDPDRLLAELTRELHERFDIDHPTIQIEHGDCENPCQNGHS